MRRQLNALLLSLAMTVPVFAYDLQPSKAAKLIKDPVHELLSIASIQCKRSLLATSPEAIKSWNCLPERMNFAYDYLNDQWAARIRGKVPPGESADLEMQHLLAGVRWPDDPNGLLRSNLPVRAKANFDRCNKWLEGDYGACGNRFCLSHFGHLQMAHSMKPSAPWCKDKNPDSPTCRVAGMETKEAIKAWVRWLIPIGQGKFHPSDEVHVKDSFATMLFDQSCANVYPTGFDYESLFFVDCSKDRWSFFKFWKRGHCTVIDATDRSTELKARAIGAILHVIQDSYARGHTLRIATGGTNSCAARISCTKITRFSDYNEQNSSEHGKADKIPVWDASCFQNDRVVDDPITAGAKVLAMFENPKYDVDDIWTYLDGRVFVKGKLPTEVQLSDDEKCFGQD
jgi:hypothetical protein